MNINEEMKLNKSALTEKNKQLTAFFIEILLFLKGKRLFAYDTVASTAHFALAAMIIGL